MSAPTVAPAAPPDRPTEVRQIHTRLLKCALEVDESRDWWRHDTSGGDVPRRAFEEYWFGDRSLPRIEVLVTNLRARFDVWPGVRDALARWEMDPTSRALVCHWHLQLSDPLYRAFTGDWLVRRRAGARPEVTRDLVFAWVEDQGPGRWTTATRVQFASKLLSAAHSAGLVATTHGPRPLVVPRVGDTALEYLLHLLHGVAFTGTILDNPYTASVGLDPATLESRLRHLPSLGFRRQGDLVDIDWRFPDLGAWAASSFPGSALAPSEAS